MLANKCLGICMTERWDHSYTVKIRVEMPWSNVLKTKEAICNKHLKLVENAPTVGCYVFLILLCGVEMWA